MKLKILIFIDWYKPGFKAGGPIRSVSNLVSQLNNEYDFYIITRNTDYLETTPYQSITSNQWNTIDGAQVYYLSSDNLNKSTIKKLIHEVNPSLIYCNSLYSPKFTITPIRIAKKQEIKTVLAPRGMLSSGSLSVKSKKKLVFIKAIKTFKFFSKTVFHATSLQEKKDILKTFGTDIQMVLAPNLPENKSIPYIAKEKDEGVLKMVFIGRIAPEKNTLFAIEVLKNCNQNIILDIYGPIYNQEYYKHCENTINQLPKNIVVAYKGALNHNLLDATLKNYHAIFLPSTGENFGHTIIEGMINSCIPVISDKTPWQNLEQQKAGFDISLDQQEKFSKTIDYLAELNKSQLNEYTKNAHSYAQNVINNNQSIEDYHKLFKENI